MIRRAASRKVGDMEDIKRITVKAIDGEWVSAPGRMIVGVLLPVSVKVTPLWSDGKYYGCSLEMADTDAEDLLCGLMQRLCPPPKATQDPRDVCGFCKGPMEGGERVRQGNTERVTCPSCKLISVRVVAEVGSREHGAESIEKEGGRDECG